MKVFAYMPTPGGLTGAPRRLLTLASVLREQGIEMCIATQRDSDLFRAAEEQGLDTVEVEPVGVLRQRHGALFGGNAVFRLKALFSLLVQNLGIARKIRKHGADVVWIRGSKGIAFAGLGALLSRRPLVWDVDFVAGSQGLIWWFYLLGLWAAKRVVFQYSYAPETIADPAMLAQHRHKFHTIIPGINMSTLEPFRKKRMAKNRRCDAPFVILQIGTICDRKNQKLMIDALVRVRELRPNDPIRVQLAGGVYEEDYAETVKKEIDAAGLGEEVEFLGWRSDIHELMADADLLAMPSRNEGVPNTVQEAMSIGLPVLVSDAGGMPEVVRDGETGWILGLDSPESWAARIDSCLENRKQLEDVGHRAAEYALEHFGTRQWGTEYYRVIAAVSRHAK